MNIAILPLLNGWNTELVGGFKHVCSVPFFLWGWRWDSNEGLGLDRKVRSVGMMLERRPTIWWLPIVSMYGIYANIWGILMVNVTIYNIHGSYGLWTLLCIFIFWHARTVESYVFMMIRCSLWETISFGKSLCIGFRSLMMIVYLLVSIDIVDIFLPVLRTHAHINNHSILVGYGPRECGQQRLRLTWDIPIFNVAVKNTIFLSIKIYK